MSICTIVFRVLFLTLNMAHYILFTFNVCSHVTLVQTYHSLTCASVRYVYFHTEASVIVWSDEARLRATRHFYTYSDILVLHVHGDAVLNGSVLLTDVVAILSVSRVRGADDLVSMHDVSIGTVNTRPGYAWREKITFVLITMVASQKLCCV